MPPGALLSCVFAAKVGLAPSSAKRAAGRVRSGNCMRLLGHTVHRCCGWGSCRGWSPGARGGLDVAGALLGHELEREAGARVRVADVVGEEGVQPAMPQVEGQVCRRCSLGWRRARRV